MALDIVGMAVEPTPIDGLLEITTKAVTDERGTVREFFRASAFGADGIAGPWAQVNLTHTHRGGLRGLHGEASDKLIGLASGAAYGAWVDARPHSPTFKTVVTRELFVGRQFFIPAGVCNGFQAVSDGGCMYLYCFSVEWQPGMAGVGLDPLDPALGIDWPITPDRNDPAMISAKDAAAGRLADL